MSDDPAKQFPEQLLSAFDFAAELDSLRKGHEEQMRALLEVADSFDRFAEAAAAAEAPTPEQAAQWRQTFLLIGKQLQQVLRAASVTPVECLGQRADPHHHQVLGVEEGPEAAEGVIVKEIVRGYQWGDRVLRPSGVIATAPVRNDP